MKSLFRLITFTAILTSVACAKSGSNSSSSVEGGNGILSCKAGRIEVDAARVRIAGHKTAQPGETVRYTLNDKLSNCGASGDLSWKASSPKAGGRVYTTGIRATFKRAGEYVLTANVASGNAGVLEVAEKIIVTEGLAINGPNLGMAQTNHTFTLAIPSGVTVSLVKWNFGDSFQTSTGMGPMEHTYWTAGNYMVTATVTLASGDQSIVQHRVNVLPFTDGMECVHDLAITGPSRVNVNENNGFSVYIPQCLQWRNNRVTWNFGDGGNATGTNVSHAYNSAGNRVITVNLYQGEATTPYLTLTRTIQVVAVDPGPGPGPQPNPNPNPNPNPDPGPGPTPTPNPDPGPGPTPTPNPDPGPGPTPTPNPDPGPGPTPTPNPDPGPGPTPTPNPDPGPGPTPTPNPDPGPGPTPTPNPDPGPGPTPTPNPNPDPGPNPNPNPDPGPNPNPGPGPGPGGPGGGEPDPDIDPDPNPQDPNQCTQLGEQRSSYSENFSEQVTCGVGGTRTDMFRTRTVQECRYQGEVLRWITVDTVREQISQGECSGVSCEIPAAAMVGVDPASHGITVVNGKYYLPHNVSKVFYSTKTPTGTCSEVAQTRACNNGTFSGSQTHNELTCRNGCPGVGPDGTTLPGVVIGQEEVPRTCQFGETVKDVWQTIADRTCMAGEVRQTNERRGTRITEAVCPGYSWAATDQWTACTAACGGEQQQIFSCRNSLGQPAPIERCMGTAPVVKRVCDGDPNSVRRSESSVKREDASRTEKCPADQIGEVRKHRDVTTTTTYACIDHKVQKEGTKVTEGAWQEERYCRNYTPYRCSQDELTEEEANGRYAWMMKCKSQVPILKEFLDVFDVSNGKRDHMTYKGMIIYATFMDKAYTPERLWKAPKTKNASCAVPSTVYIAAICQVDCATPEQQIMAQNSSGKMEYTKYEQAWQREITHVATLMKGNLNGKRVQRAEVEKWMTGSKTSTKEILVFTMKSGGQLRLTPGHILITPEGATKSAVEYKVGENLVMLGGVLDPIVSIQETSFIGPVFNLYVKSNEPEKNVVITNGYLNGTAFFQSQGLEYMNRQILRTNLTRGVFGK